ncbi:MAG: L-serine ammonia-lyase, iron-sulfur-dependent subunit beta [Limnochordia bacterium]|jgi:L-serine dehydratase
MPNIGIFDIVGPVMVGPSSSHTAGAVRLGLAGRNILGEAVRRAEIGLHGSFAATYWGHRTDLALLAGLLGLAMDDPLIPQARELAGEQGLEYRFYTADLGEVHPNTVLMRLWGERGQLELLGSSIGGGRIEILAIDGFEISVDGSYSVLITQHQDTPGIVAEVTSRLARHKINIAFLKVSRKRRGSDALLVAETDDPLDESLVADISRIPGVHAVRTLDKF